VSFCSADEIKAIEMSESGPPRYHNKDNCLRCGICYLVCPQTDVLNEELNKRYDFKVSIGNWKKISSGQSTSLDVLKKATDGGVVTSILMYLLDNNLINGAIVSKKEGIFNRVPFFATTKKELIEAAGSHYDISQGLGKLEKYSTFIPTITELKKVVNTEQMNIAVVGTPCQIHSIRKMQELKILPAHIVKYCLGLFCNLNFSFREKERNSLESEHNFSFQNVENINIKEDMIINLVEDNEIHIKFDDLYEHARPACFACRDFSNVYADISFGGLGSQEGFTTSIIRTETGEKIYRKALKEGYIAEPTEINTSVKKSESLAKVITMEKKKYQRYEKTFKDKKL